MIWLLFVLQPPTGWGGVTSEISDMETRGDLQWRQSVEEITGTESYLLERRAFFLARLKETGGDKVGGGVGRLGGGTEVSGSLSTRGLTPAMQE